uniref:Uncharacterized protein n=1 Tax=Anopheles atroparvus TaxID=41427 RepID=A0AAG5D747_ANOAO
MQLGSHYINVALLAELIERKGHLWARAFPAPLANREEKKEAEKTPSDRCLLAQEVHSIVESLRLIFRQRTEFIELTLLHVPVVPEHAPLLAPVFAAFLSTPPDDETPTSTTGLAIYRTNDVETYARLILCYAKWKALYRAFADATEPTEWTRIDTIALSQLPFDCPRVLCPRDARLRNVCISRQGSFPIGAGVVTPAGRTHHTVTGVMLRTLPNRADLQELCLKFIEAYRGGMKDDEPRARHQDENSMLACSAAYKSMSTLIDRTDLRHPGGDICAATSTRLSRQKPRSGIAAEMKPIIIPDSDDGDETSAGDTIPRESDQSTPPPAPSSPLPSSTLGTLAVAGSAGAERSNRNASNTPLAGESVADAGAASCWPPFVECLLNTPPATPQQEVVTEPADEDHRRSLPVKKPVPGTASWCRLKGMVRSIGRRKKRSTVTVAVRHALKRMFDDGDGAGCWWSFADVLAVQIPFALDVRWCSSIIKVPMEPFDGCAVDAHLVPVGRPFRQEAHAASNNPRELSSHRPSSPNDALLLELIGCLDAPDSSMSCDWTPSGCVDFAIPLDNPERADRSQPNAVEDRASPSKFGEPVDTFPLFASGSDRFVHLLTALGPASWPIG